MTERGRENKESRKRNLILGTHVPPVIAFCETREVPVVELMWDVGVGVVDCEGERRGLTGETAIERGMGEEVVGVGVEGELPPGVVFWWKEWYHGS